MERFSGEQIVGLRRRGKMILIDCSSGLHLLFHLKMTGQLFLCRKEMFRDKHTHLVISFEGQDRELRFRDVRKFGFLRGLYSSEVGAASEFSRLGPEPLEMDFFSFLALLQRRRGRLKSLLLNQSVIAGIGNIYADEILFESRLHPASEASRLKREELRRLWRAIPLILTRAIECRGSSVRDYRDGNGREGDYQNHLQVYGREGEPCLICGREIKRLRFSGRSSYCCPSCQKLRRKRKHSTQGKIPRYR